MKIYARTLAVGLTLLSPHLLAADNAAEAAARAQCATWANEDGILQEDMEQYMADCVAEQLTAQQEVPQD
jgi:hypothetical protein